VATANVSAGPFSSAYSPVAVQALAVAHETPNSSLSVGPAGLGAAWMLQPVPFQCSISDCGGVKSLAARSPTAEHALADARRFLA